MATDEINKFVCFFYMCITPTSILMLCIPTYLVSKGEPIFQTYGFFILTLARTYKFIVASLCINFALLKIFLMVIFIRHVNTKFKSDCPV
jgi:hypothetical protein